MKYKKICSKCGKEFVIELFGDKKQREYILSYTDECPDGCSEEGDFDYAK